MHNNLDRQYKELLEHILHFGTQKEDRTGTGTRSIFGWQIRHNMSEGFPLITTKEIHWSSVVTELIWFLRGDTNIQYLVDNGCNIWNGDAYKNYLKRSDEFVQSGHKNLHIDKWKFYGVVSSLDNGHEIRQFTKNEFRDKIRKSNTFAAKWGDLGPIYGKQWRNWEYGDDKAIKNGETYPNGEFKYDIKKPHIDQIQWIIDELKTNPDSRRLIVNAWNVGELPKMVLPPCHYGFQCYTRLLTYQERYKIWFKNNYQTGFEFNNNEVVDFENEYWTPTPERAISLMWNQRSVDTFLGLPFNIASYGLLLTILGEIVNMVPEHLVGNLGDVHLYNNHIEQAKLQITRQAHPLPSVSINGEFWAPDEKSDKGCGMGAGTYASNFDALARGFEISDFEIRNYISHPKIEAPLSN